MLVSIHLILHDFSGMALSSLYGRVFIVAACCCYLYLPFTILAFQLVPNSRYMFLILGSGVPNNRDPSLKLGSGDPETRYVFQRKIGLFLVFKTQKILKHNPKLYPPGIFSLAAFVLDLFMFCRFW